MKSNRHHQHSEEIELKLALPSSDSSRLAKRLARTPLLAHRKPAHLSLHNIYFDTPDALLRQEHVALRLRRIGNEVKPQWLQTLKMGEQDHSALSQRGEWEVPRPDGTLAWDALTSTPWSRIDADGSVFQALVPCFVTSFERTCWTVRRRDGSVVEIALDVGHITTRDKSSPICELELELLVGQPQALFEIAQQIARTLAVLPLNMSKAERAYALAQASLNMSRRAQAPLLTPDLPRPLAAQQLLQEMFSQFTANLNILCSSDEPEVVHQARIGWRRFRSTCRLFRSSFLHNEAPAWQALQPLLTLIGELRDLDVARTETLPPLVAAYTAAHPRRKTSWQTLELALREAASRHRQAVRNALEDTAVGASLLATTQWLENLSAKQERGAAKDQRKASLQHWAQRRVVRLHKQLQLALQQADTPEQQHRVRILAKRIRYGIEALRPLLPKKDSQRWYRQAAQLQSTLGRRRDLMQASALAAQFGANRGLVAFLHDMALAQAQKR